jgi:hypothetical protein
VVEEATVRSIKARPPGSRCVTSAAFAIALSGSLTLPPPCATAKTAMATTITAKPAPIHFLPPRTFGGTIVARSQRARTMCNY